MEIKRTVDEAIADVIHGRIPGLTGRIGYVYPDMEESYYMHSNLWLCECVECTDGFFYAELEEK